MAKFTDLSGHFLVASPALLDANFARSVILVVQHDEQGALGLVITRPLELAVADVLEKALERPFDIEDSLYLGGPCEGPLMALHDYAAASDINPTQGVHFASKRETLERLLEERPDALSRFFAGYSGWTSGQLEKELAAGSWYVVKATAGQIFGDCEGLWQDLSRRAVLEKYVPAPLIPDQPGMN
jgi:putative transcriptional regulator